jgi:hypothetical protein
LHCQNQMVRKEFLKIDGSSVARHACFVQIFR